MLKIFFTVFFSVFFAELFDKTQLATLAFAANFKHAALIVFAASALALTLSSALGVFVGSISSKYFSPKIVHILSGTMFIIIGAYLIYKNV